MWSLFVYVITPDNAPDPSNEEYGYKDKLNDPDQECRSIELRTTAWTKYSSATWEYDVYNEQYNVKGRSNLYNWGFLQIVADHIDYRYFIFNYILFDYIIL
jgi:hypothetical protein